jgi:DNA invertase Pin-like site-specific DNA recombinase
LILFGPASPPPLGRHVQGGIPPPALATTSIVFSILGFAAKLERRILERTARGRADAKAKGVRFGRKPKLTPHQRSE